MSISRHRNRTPEVETTEEKQPILAIVEMPLVEVIPVTPPVEEKTEETTTSTKSRSTISRLIRGEEITTPKRKAAKNGKVYSNVSIIGETAECKDFRAIVKKKGLFITDVLTKIIKDWNTTNYNL